MGKKKPKDPKTNPQSDDVSPPADIFKALFGGAQDENAAISIFSDDNPFRRKPNEKAQEASGNPNHGGSFENPDIGELKKRKRNDEKTPSVTPLEAKKSKKEKLQSSGSEEGDGEHSIERRGGDGEGMVKEKKKKKKKRKRDELEKEYEERKYGAIDNTEVEDRQRLGGKVGEKRKTVDNPAEMLVSKDGFDDESKLLRTVFVGNLPLTVKKKAMIKEFSKFGEVESVRIRSVPITDTKKPRKGAVITKQFHEAADSVHAYVVFKTEESAQASLLHNMAVIGGHHIRVDRACPPRKKMKGDGTSLYDYKRTVFVGNLPFDVKDEEVYQLFCGTNNMESSIEGVRIIRDPHNNLGKGFAYVLFKTREAAHLVVKKRNLKLRDRELRVFHAKPDSTLSKRRNPTPAENVSSPAKKFQGSGTADRSKKIFTNASMSYQGLRASKSGVQKKVAIGSSRPDKFNSKTQKGTEGRKEKRPAVAARKVKSNALKETGASKQAGMKRKMDSRTPDGSYRKKKAKKFS